MKLLIVGGVAGGASAAARARRFSEETQIILFERGPDVSFANCGLPYYVGGEIAVRDKLLVTTPERYVPGSISTCASARRSRRSTAPRKRSAFAISPRAATTTKATTS